MPELMTTEELTKYLKVSRQTIYMWRKDGLPFKRIGTRHVRFELSEVMEWLEGREIKE